MRRAHREEHEQEFTSRELLNQRCRNAVPGANHGEELPRPAYAPHLHPVGEAAPTIRLFAMIGLILIDPLDNAITSLEESYLATDVLCCVSLKHL